MEQPNSFSFRLAGPASARNADSSETVGQARLGFLTTSRGTVATPAFLPALVGGSVAGLTPEDLAGFGTEMLFGSLFGSSLRPGVDTIERLGGLRRLAGWSGPILAESGTSALFEATTTGGRPASSEPRVTENGLHFASPLDGSRREQTPEGLISDAARLDVDAAIALVQPASSGLSAELSRAIAERNERWSERALAAGQAIGLPVLAVLPSGLADDWLLRNAGRLSVLGFAGAFVQPPAAPISAALESARAALALVVPSLPASWPRALGSSTHPLAIFASVAAGADLLTSVEPARLGRRGILETASGYIDARADEHRLSAEPPDADCDCYTCQQFSRAYLHHLFAADELLGYRLATLHNFHFVSALLQRIRASLLSGELGRLRDATLESFGDGQTPDAAGAPELDEPA